MKNGLKSLELGTYLDVKKPLEIGIYLNNRDIIGTVTDSTKSDVHMILELPENEYNEVVYGKTNSKIIFENLSNKYRMEIDKFLKQIKNEAA